MQSRTDYFNEAIVTAMLCAGGGSLSFETVKAPGKPAAEATPPDGTTPAASLRARLFELLEQGDHRAIQDGIPREYVDAADFAACAFIDETLLSSAWKGREEWMQNPLQLARHATGTAGEEFYRILDGLLEKEEAALPDRAGKPAANAPEEDSSQKALRAVLEIFALCLAQGFTGMYFHDEGAVRRRLDRIGNIVPAVAGIRESGDGRPLFPAAYPTNAPRRKTFDLLRRFDLLDWLLWLTPPATTAILYHLCDARLDNLLNALLQGSKLP
jgi:type VI secretion system protein ImpK